MLSRYLSSKVHQDTTQSTFNAPKAAGKTSNPTADNLVSHALRPEWSEEDRESAKDGCSPKRSPTHPSH